VHHFLDIEAIVAVEDGKELDDEEEDLGKPDHLLYH
jgi:hypothetical protein